MIYYKDTNNKIHAYNDDVDEKVNQAKYDKYLKSKVENDGYIKITKKQAMNLTKVVETLEHKIAKIRRQYDDEIKKVCAKNLFNDINSARNLSTLQTSPLQPLAEQITNWELEQQTKFIALLADAKNGSVKIKNSTFDDNFIKFKQA